MTAENMLAIPHVRSGYSIEDIFHVRCAVTTEW
jgi:hypothetical protein